MPPSSTNRIAFFDNLKGFLILLVLIGHFFQDYPSIRWPIYAFHMPLFVFISGYFSKSLVVDGRYRMEKPLGILFLYLGASILSCWVQGRWLPTFLESQWGLWYLQALFVWYLLVPTLAILHNRWICLATLLLFMMLVAETSSLGIWKGSRLLQYTLFFMAGYLAPKNFHNRFRMNGNAKCSTKCLIAGGGIGVVLSAIVLWHFTSVGATFWHNDMPMGFSTTSEFVGWSLRFFVIAPLFSLLVLALMPRRRLAPLAFLGERTLQIYVCHAMFWPWEWQTRKWLLPVVDKKTASGLAFLIWLGIFLLPFWHVPLKYLQTLPSRLLPAREP